jgi:hypothetical protein
MFHRSHLDLLGKELQMRTGKGRAILAATAVIALVLGVGSALAATNGNGKPSLKDEAANIAGRAASQAAIAKSLGTTTAKLNAAIKADALAQIDAAQTSGDITADEATTLKDAVNDGTAPAIHFATAAGVAKLLGTTEAKLNAAYGDEQKARAKARVDQALKDGKITDQQASDMKAKIDAATFPGFGAGPGGPGGPGGPHGHGGPGFGFGPPPAGSGSSGGTGSLTPALRVVA